MKKVLSILALALALVACNDKPQWEPAAPSQPVVTSLTLDTAKAFSSNTLNRTEIHHINGAVIKLSLYDATDYDVVDYTAAHHSQLVIGISAAQLGDDDAKDGVVPCQILCVGPVNSINDIDLSLANTTNADFETPAPAPAPAPEPAEAGEGENNEEAAPIKLEWANIAALPALNAEPEEKKAEADPLVYNSSSKIGYIVRHAAEELNEDGSTTLTVYETYAVVVDSFSATEAVVENEVQLPNIGSSTVIPEYSYSCVAGLQYKRFDGNGFIE